MNSYQYPGARKCAVRECPARRCMVGWLYAVAVGHVIGVAHFMVGAAGHFHFVTARRLAACVD